MNDQYFSERISTRLVAIAKRLKYLKFAPFSKLRELNTHRIQTESFTLPTDDKFGLAEYVFIDLIPIEKAEDFIEKLAMLMKKGTMSFLDRDIGRKLEQFKKIGTKLFPGAWHNLLSISLPDLKYCRHVHLQMAHEIGSYLTVCCTCAPSEAFKAEMQQILGQVFKTQPRIKKPRKLRDLIEFGAVIPFPISKVRKAHAELFLKLETEIQRTVMGRLPTLLQSVNSEYLGFRIFEYSRKKDPAKPNAGDNFWGQTSYGDYRIFHESSLGVSVVERHEEEEDVIHNIPGLDIYVDIDADTEEARKENEALFRKMNPIVFQFGLPLIVSTFLNKYEMFILDLRKNISKSLISKRTSVSALAKYDLANLEISTIFQQLPTEFFETEHLLVKKADQLKFQSKTLPGQPELMTNIDRNLKHKVAFLKKHSEFLTTKLNGVLVTSYNISNRRIAIFVAMLSIITLLATVLQIFPEWKVWAHDLFCVARRWLRG